MWRSRRAHLPEVLASYQSVIDEANAAMAWGVDGVDNWYKSASGHVSQNWPLATIEYWDLTRTPDPAHYDFSPVPHRPAAGP